MQGIYLRFHIPLLSPNFPSLLWVFLLKCGVCWQTVGLLSQATPFTERCKVWLVRLLLALVWNVTGKAAMPAHQLQAADLSLREESSRCSSHLAPRARGPQILLNSFKYNLVNLTSQFSFSIVSRYSDDSKSACFFASFMLLMQISKSMLVSYVTTALGPCMSWGSWTFCYVTM